VILALLDEIELAFEDVFVLVMIMLFALFVIFELLVNRLFVFELMLDEFVAIEES